MFLGTYRPNLIGKGRIALPKKIREELKGNKVVLTVGFERCIYGFEERAWEEIIRPELARPLFSDSEGRNLRRKMCAEAIVVQLGAQGRFVIPEEMIKYAGIKDDLTIVGAGDHFEIWDSKEWSDYLEEIESLQK